MSRRRSPPRRGAVSAPTAHHQAYSPRAAGAEGFDVRQPSLPAYEGGVVGGQRPCVGVGVMGVTGAPVATMRGVARAGLPEPPGSAGIPARGVGWGPAFGRSPGSCRGRPAAFTDRDRLAPADRARLDTVIEQHPPLAVRPAMPDRVEGTDAVAMLGPHAGHHQRPELLVGDREVPADGVRGHRGPRAPAGKPAGPAHGSGPGCHRPPCLAARRDPRSACRDVRRCCRSCWVP